MDLAKHAERARKRTGTHLDDENRGRLMDLYKSVKKNASKRDCAKIVL